MDPTKLNNFISTKNFLGNVGEGKVSYAEVTDEGYISIWANNDAAEWFSEEEGYYVDAYVDLSIGWYLRQNDDLFTAKKLTLNDSNKLIAIKVKQEENYLEEAPLELWFSVPSDPKSNNLAANLVDGVVFSLTTIHGADGFDYLVFDMETSDDYDLWRGPLANLQLKWASCMTVVDPSLGETETEGEVDEETETEDEANKITHPAKMDIYEICFFGTQEDLEAYVGSEFEWETEPDVEVETEEVPTKTPTKETEAATTTASSGKGGCKSVVASVSVLAATVLAAGVIVCKKKD
jgi:hypothetical protein